MPAYIAYVFLRPNEASVLYMMRVAMAPPALTVGLTHGTEKRTVPKAQPPTTTPIANALF